MKIEDAYKKGTKVIVSKEAKYLKHSGKIAKIKEVSSNYESGILEMAYKINLPDDPVHGPYYVHSELELLTED